MYIKILTFNKIKKKKNCIQTKILNNIQAYLNLFLIDFVRFLFYKNKTLKTSPYTKLRNNYLFESQQQI